MAKEEKKITKSLRNSAVGNSRANKGSGQISEGRTASKTPSKASTGKTRASNTTNKKK